MVQLIELLGNKKVLAILDIFLRTPSVEMSQTELIRKIKIAKATAVKWMGFLVKQNFLTFKKIGVTNLYSLDNNNVIIKQLKIMNTVIQLQYFSRLSGLNIEIYLYGSCARGEDNEHSDVDILIIGRIKRNEISDIIGNISEKIKKNINYSIFNNVEWSVMQKKDRAYYERVEKDKIRLI